MGIQDVGCRLHLDAKPQDLRNVSGQRPPSPADSKQVWVLGGPNLNPEPSTSCHPDKMLRPTEACTADSIACISIESSSRMAAGPSDKPSFGLGVSGWLFGSLGFLGFGGQGTELLSLVVSSGLASVSGVGFKVWQPGIMTNHSKT